MKTLLVAGMLIFCTCTVFALGVGLDVGGAGGDGAVAATTQDDSDLVVAGMNADGASVGIGSVGLSVG